MSEELLPNAGRPTGTRAISRRGFLRYSGMVAAAGLLAACAPAPQQAAAPQAASSAGGTAPTTIRMVSWFWNEPGRSDAWRTMIERFHEAQDSVRVEEAGWPFDQFTNNIVVQMQAGAIDGDLITTTPDLVLRLLKADRLVPVEDVLDRAGVKNLSASHDFIRKDGHLYGLDIVTVAFGLLYNSMLFERAGVEPPTTIDEWVAATEKLTDRPDQFGIFSPHLMSEPESFWFILQEWALPYDGVWAKEQTPLVNSPEIVNGMKLFKQMYDIGMPQGTTDATAQKMFGDNRIAQYMIVSALVNVLKSAAPDLYPLLRSAAPPWPSRRSMARIHPITVNVDSEHQEAAKDFLTFLYTPENYQQLLELSLDVIPSFPDGIRQEYLDSLTWVEGYNAIVPVAPPDLMGEFIFNNQEFGQVVISKMQESLTTDKPVEDAMNEAQIELEALAERLFA
ncbi:MAG: extracellular solute-binding protein [Caldilineaceae bacterium]|nr:extracellular solute-binding protein [Caldilineaceae bacterium]